MLAAMGSAHAHDHDHPHDHDHGHDRALPPPHGATCEQPGAREQHDEAERRRDRHRLLFAIGLTGVIFVAEIVGGLYSGSLALLSDAGHMLTDVSAQVISLLALLLAT